MDRYSDAASYEAQLQKRSVLPAGFSAASVSFSFIPKEKETARPYGMNMSAIVLDRPTGCFAGMFTRNKAPGAPVVIGRELLRSDFCRGVVINNRIANVCAPGGVEAARAVTGAFAEAAGWNGTEAGVIFPSSTGIIGWSLPVEEMKKAAGALAVKVAAKEGNGETGSMMPVARGIMTTDSFPKVRSAECGGGRIVAVAKGAGMIEPNMATMLVFITTDIELRREYAGEALRRVCAGSFNRISVDGDQSTSDTVLFFSSCRVPEVKTDEFEEALFDVCRRLAEDIVRNGEGTNHVIRAEVTGAADEATAAGFGKAVVNSPLVKTAVYGNDPNVGRIIMALGDYAGNNGIDFSPEQTVLRIGDVPVFQNGSFLIDEEKEKTLSGYLRDRALGDEKSGFPRHEKNVEIRVELRSGSCGAVVFGSDLSYEYVRENADYRT